MTDKDFEEQLTTILKASCKDKYTIEVKEIEKNYTTMTGVIFDKIDGKKDMGHKVTPVLYVENAYSDFLDGKSILDICSSMIKTIDEVYENNVVSDLMAKYNRDNWEKLVEDWDCKLIMTAIPESEDEKSTKNYYTIDTPTGKCGFKLSLGEGQFLTIKNDMVDMFNLEEYTKDELRHIAIENFMNNHMVVQTLLGAIADPQESGGVNEIPDELPKDEPIVISGYEIPGSTGMILSKQVLEYVCDKYGFEDVYIIPSSIHEVILLNKDGIEPNSVDYMLSSLAEVNLSVLDPSEIFSYNIYEFNTEDKKIEVIEG